MRTLIVTLTLVAALGGCSKDNPAVATDGGVELPDLLGADLMPTPAGRSLSGGIEVTSPAPSTKAVRLRAGSLLLPRRDCTEGRCVTWQIAPGST